MDLHAEIAQISSRAAAAGRPLRAVPTIELGEGPRSRVVSVEHPARIQLSRELLQIPADERAWTIAHELSHVLRHQERSRAPHSRRLAAAGLLLAGLSAAGVAAVAWWLLADGPSDLRNIGAIVGWLAVVALWLVYLTMQRREEAECDRTAAEVFGEILSPAGVIRLQHTEGRGSALVPTWLRSHAHPRDRRRIGLTVQPRAVPKKP